MTDSHPKILATFVLDKEGKPVSSDGHYKIKLSVADTPDDTYAVTYFLDPTYFDPVREARDREENFSEILTSYGDYDVTAKVRAKENSSLIKRNLYDALEESYSKSADPILLKALQDIKSN